MTKYALTQPIQKAEVDENPDEEMWFSARKRPVALKKAKPC